MDIEGSLFIFALGLALSSPKNAGSTLILQDTRITTITRQNTGDIFTTEDKVCNVETCIGLSSGTAGTPRDGTQMGGTCSCQCHSHLPAFREDLQICVDDIHECVLSPFVSGSMSQQIPFVFLPLKGQIIHPSKEISFAGIQTPVCAVSGAKFLTDGGWIDLRNPLDADVPFRLFRDEGRTFLQWVGEPELRSRMGGRLVLVHLMCREIAKTDKTIEDITVFTPCVAFRVVGTPEKYLSNVSEVVFVPDPGDTQNGNSTGLSVSEYVAIGICSILLGLIYVASVFLYLHLRRRRRDAEKKLERRDKQNLASVEEGIIKNNPLLGLGRHFVSIDASYSDSCSSENEPPPDVIQNQDDRINKMQITAAMIHPQLFGSKFIQSPQIQPSHQESIEKLPEENVSIVETMDCREDRPDSLKMISSTRRKLYFNPAYFDPQLLVAPPPAAVEFLTKIREVISLAKQKMASKKFTPSLIEIPEEEMNHPLDVGSEYSRALGSRRGSAISLKRENSRRKTCSGCPGCEPQDFKALSGKLPEFPSLAACQSCASTNTESKQISIRKWLEDVPVIKATNASGRKAKSTGSVSPKSIRSPTRIRSPVRSISPDHITPVIRKSSRPSSERSGSPVYDNKTSSVKSVSSRRSSSTVKTAITSKKVIAKPKAPPPPVPKAQNIYDVIAEKKSLPDMVHEAVAIEKNCDAPRVPTITKKMKAVINELSSLDHVKAQANDISYEADSLERSRGGNRTPIDYAEVSSSQPSPSLSSALPLDEEMTMQNAIINTKTGNMTLSKLNMEEILNPDDHDYELIILKKGNTDDTFIKLPEILQRDKGYSLVSEVYVNNGYNYGSSPSTPAGSNSSTLERAPKIIYEPNNPGHLLIEVEDCPDNYIKAEDSDAYEPDTLDRKPKLKLVKDPISDSEYVDSLERPNQILLRTTGTFKKEDNTDAVDAQLNRKFGSLREIYEAKNKRQELWKLNYLEPNGPEGRILTLEERHCRRQRSIPMPPDVIPPNTHEDGPIYERPKPPRKVYQTEDEKPPLPPKNGSVRSAQKPRTSLPDYQPKASDISILKNFIHTEDILFKNGVNNQIILQASSITTNPVDLNPKTKTWGKVMKIVTKPEDSGYLSTDSNDSHGKKKCKDCDRGSAGSETDESLGDAHSESGAESVETHSVFFGSYRKSSCVSGSIDSGVGSEGKHNKGVNILKDKT